MERTLSQDIRNEREELREAAEQTLNAIVDLNLDGTVKWVSPSWTDVVGTPFDAINGKPMSDLIVGDSKNVFTDMVVSMKKDDSKSYRIRFAIQLGPLSKLRDLETLGEDEQVASELEPQTAVIEAQGIMVYDSASGGESHVSLLLSVTDKAPASNSLTKTYRLCGCFAHGPPRRRFKSTYQMSLLIPLDLALNCWLVT